MELIGQPVNHISFGKGIVTDLSSQMVTVQFAQGEKKFLYPQAFSSFLTLKDADSQNAVNAKYRRILQQEEAHWRKETAKSDRRRQLDTLKLTSNDQAAFNLDWDQAPAALRQGQVFSGRYLSGDSKGQPRRINRLKPNSACLVTSIPPNGTEADRKILGLFMVPDNFWGTRCLDGIIPAHKTLTLTLPSEAVLSYWDYCPRKENLPAWGRIPFKYFSTRAVRDILQDLVSKLEETPQQELSQKLLHYFCALNRLSEKRRL